MSILVMKLAPQERDLYAAHLLALEPGERYLRFSTAMSDEAIRRYVRGIDLTRDRLYAALVKPDSAHLVGADAAEGVTQAPIGMAHLARGFGYAEVGVSVLAPYQRRHIGSLLLEHCIAQCRHWGVSELFTHFLSQNAGMARLAGRFGMQIVAEGGQSDAYLAVTPASVSIAASPARAASVVH